MNGEAPTDRFRRLFAETERELLAYVLRRVDRGEDAADVAAETFLVAWRRMDRVPEGDEARLWLYGVARRQLANQRRGEVRRSRLADRLRAELPVVVASARIPEDHRVAAVRAALARLEEEDREILRLSSWEGLLRRRSQPSWACPASRFAAGCTVHASASAPRCSSWTPAR